MRLSDLSRIATIDPVLSASCISAQFGSIAAHLNCFLQVSLDSNDVQISDSSSESGYRYHTVITLTKGNYEWKFSLGIMSSRFSVLLLKSEALIGGESTLVGDMPLVDVEIPNILLVTPKNHYNTIFVVMLLSYTAESMATLLDADLPGPVLSDDTLAYLQNPEAMHRDMWEIRNLLAMFDTDKRVKYSELKNDIYKLAFLSLFETPPQVTADSQ